MGEQQSTAEAVAIAREREGRAADWLAREAETIARLTLGASAGRACLTGWEYAGIAGEIRVPSGDGLDLVLDRLLAIAGRVILPSANASGPPSIKILGPSDLAPLLY